MTHSQPSFMVLSSAGHSNSRTKWIKSWRTVNRSHRLPTLGEGLRSVQSAAELRKAPLLRPLTGAHLEGTGGSGECDIEKLMDLQVLVGENFTPPENSRVSFCRKIRFF